MTLNGFLKRSLIGLLVVMMVPFGALSQETATSGGTFSEAQLDQMLAPIALYPDSLLAQVLLAATFPNQVAEEDGFLKANPDLKGDALNDALDRMNWDLSVKALAPFPQIVAMMADKWDWTQKVGEAFKAQESDVMASVQRLRSKAYAAGNLKTTSEQKVVVKGEVYEIEPASPEVVYVPRYDPAVVYGTWWWPSYPPLAYYPVWPGVAVAAGVFGFWGAVSVGPVWGWGWGAWNWGGGFMNVNVNRNININRNVNINRNFRTTNARDVAGRRGEHRMAGGGERGRGGNRGTGNIGGRGGTRGGGAGHGGSMNRGGANRGNRGTGNVGAGGGRGGKGGGGGRGAGMRKGGAGGGHGGKGGGGGGRGAGMHKGGGGGHRGGGGGGGRGAGMRKGGGGHGGKGGGGGHRGGGGGHRGGGGGHRGGGGKGGGGGHRGGGGGGRRK